MTEVWQRPLRSDAERNRRLVLEAAALLRTRDLARIDATQPVMVGA